jgi:hypothetical protein
LDFIEWVSKEIAEGHMMGDQVMDGLTSEVAHSNRAVQPTTSHS